MKQTKIVTGFSIAALATMGIFLYSYWKKNGTVKFWKAKQEPQEEIESKDEKDILTFVPSRVEDTCEVSKEEPKKEFNQTYTASISNYMSTEKKPEEPKTIGNKKEYISPDEVGETGFEIITFTYFSDGILADEDGTAIPEPEALDLLGMDYEKHIGDYEDDCIHIRNHGMHVDYEILKDDRTYSAYELSLPKSKRRVAE